jgi:tellurite resistance-related uncharacterized protein
MFDEHTVPAALLHEHRTKDGIWGRIVVVAGAVLYRVLEPESAEYTLTPGDDGIAQPGPRRHYRPTSRRS